MPFPEYAEDDFRAGAVVRSARMLGRAGIEADASDLSAAGASLCVAASPDIAARRRAISGLLVLQLAVTFGLLICGAALVYCGWFRMPPLAAGLRFACGPAGVVLAGIGWLMVSTASDIEGAIVRMLLRRYASPVPAFTPTEKPASRWQVRKRPSDWPCRPTARPRCSRDTSTQRRRRLWGS